MLRPVDAIVTGFTKNAALCEASLEPLRALKRAGALRRIVYVTWALPEIDEHLGPVMQMPDVELIRVPSPAVNGGPYQRGVVYQVRNLAAALDKIDGDETLVLKTRPDFVANIEFLRAKIASFETLCARRDIQFDGIDIPPSPFKKKIWIPWADANQPFFYEDATCLGLKCDVAKLVTPDLEAKIAVMATTENIYGPFAHVVRFCTIFRQSWPIFARYLRDYRFFVNNMDYRAALVPQLANEPFFWHLVAAHALVLANNFHVDCGRPGDMVFFPNSYNTQVDWSSIANLRVNPPFGNIEAWRSYQMPGSMLQILARPYARLMDDAWQHRLFAGPLTDVPADTIVPLLKGAVLYRKGVLAASEDRFYRALADAYRQHWLRRAA